MRLKYKLVSILALAVAGAGCSAAEPNADVDTDTALISSGLPTTVAEYKLPAYRDLEVLPTADVELWAALHRPATLTAGTRYPLVVLLHGNHETCRNATTGAESNEYAETGVCPEGSDPLPNHRGYDYLATDLASRGYLVL